MKRAYFLFCVLISFILPSSGWGQENKDVKADGQLYFVGGGIASLSGAVFAIRDGKVPGKNVHIFESMKTLGGALDGYGGPETGYVVRGARKYDNTDTSYGCLWDLMKSVPGMYDPKKTLYDEFVEWNKLYPKKPDARFLDKDKNAIPMLHTGLTWKDRWDIVKLCIFTSESSIENRSVDSWFQPSFFKTYFWYGFASMFGFEPYDDLTEMRRYLRKFAHGFPHMFKGTTQDLEVTHPINQYESLILPIQKWLAARGVDFKLGCKVTDLDFEPGDKITVNRILYTQDGQAKDIVLGKNDCVFVTNGSKVAKTTQGSMKEPAPKPDLSQLDISWSLWDNIAKKKPGRLGNPSNFYSHLDKSGWVWFCITSKDKTFFDLFEKKTGNVAGFSDLVVSIDSNWMMSVQVPAQPHFLNQPKDVYFWLGYALNSNVPGNYVKKPLIDCSGEEILTEICYQYGFEKDLPHILATSICIPINEPYVISQFLPRKKSDRPLPVPEGSTNLGFMGQYVESGECIFLVEASVRSAQMAVYQLLHVDKKVNPVYEGIKSTWNNIKLIRALSR